MKVTDSQSTINWYDENAEQYARNTFKYPPPSQLLDKFAEYLPGKKILDAGCGPGRDSGYFSEQGYKVIGVDLSKGLLEVAKKRFPQCKFVEGDLRNLPFEDDSFDGIWANASLVHMDTRQDVELTLGEFYRVLRQSGILYIFVKTSEKETDIVSDVLSGHDRFFRYYKENEIDTLLNRLGFNILESFPLDDPVGRSEVKWLVVYSSKQ